jgi:integrase
MTGLHLVRMRLKAADRWYVYAWRGGPCIHQADGRKPDITPAMLQAAMDARRSPQSTGTVEWLVREYRASPEFKGLRAPTRRDYERSLDRVEARFGPASLGAFEDRRIRNDIIQWRDEWRSTPRTADKVLVMLQTLLSWAVERGFLAINAAHGIKLIHKADRSDMVWEDHHWQAMQASTAEGQPICPAHLMTALKLISMTGLRLGDVIRLDWDHVGEKVIVLKTKKRGGRAAIPIFPELRALLDSIKNGQPHRTGPHPTGTVLRNSRDKAWTESGLGSVFQKSKPAGFDRTMHDLRGTYVTWLAVKGFTDEEIARVIGWTAKRIASIRARYVDEARVVVSMVDRMVK